MRTHVLVAALLAALSFAYSASAANTLEPASTSYKGLWISVGVAATESVELDLTLRNAGMPPQRVTLAAAGLPNEWNALFLGNGRPVDSAFLAPDSSVDVTLRVAPPQGVKPGSYQFQIAATADDGTTFDLPIYCRARRERQSDALTFCVVTSLAQGGYADENRSDSPPL